MTPETDQQTPKVPFTEADFMRVYGDFAVQVAGLPKMPFTLTVNIVADMEKDFCHVKPEDRSDEGKRLSQLASYVGEAALLPEHRSLLRTPPEDSQKLDKLNE